jgi:hypothetical protein
VGQRSSTLSIDAPPGWRIGSGNRARKSSASFGAGPVTGPFAFICVHLRLKNLASWLRGRRAVGSRGTSRRPVVKPGKLSRR